MRLTRHRWNDVIVHLDIVINVWVTDSLYTASLSGYKYPSSYSVTQALRSLFC